MENPLNTNKNRRRWPYVIGGMVTACILGAGTATAAGGLGPTDWLDLRSPNGTIHRVTVGDDGKLTAAPQVTATPTASPTSTTPTSTPTQTSTAPTITYAGAWTRGADNYTSTVGASATIRFTGTSLTATGFKASHHKNATVTVDGVSKGFTTSVAATRTEGTILSLTGLPAGGHTVVLTATGTFSITGFTAAGGTASPTTAVPTSSPTSSTPITVGIKPLKVVGNQIQYTTGGEAWLIGVNSFTFGGGCGTPSELAAASQANAKAFIDSMRHDGHGALRLFYWSGYSNTVKNNLQELVNYAASKNVYTILTLSDGQKGCGNAGPSTLSANSYAHVKEAATRFKGNAGVAFFEQANEPNQEAWDQGYLDKARTTTATIKGIDSTRLVGTGTQAPYFLGGGSVAESERRWVEVGKTADIQSLHGYEESGCDESRTKRALELAGNSPVIMGEFGVLADSSSFARRAQLFDCKLKTWAGYKGFAGAFAWSAQPGNGGSSREYGNVEASPADLKVLREASLG